MYNTQFCLENETRDSRSGIILHWPETRVHTVQVSEELCLDEQSIPVRRKCDFNIRNGPFWSTVNGNCMNQPNGIEQQLHDTYLSNKSTNEILVNLSEISHKILERPTVAKIDLSVKIIEMSFSDIKNSSALPTVNTLKIVDDLMMVNRSVHIKVKSVILSKSTIIGWGVNDNFQITEIHSHQTLDNIMEVFRKEKLTTAFYLSKENLRQLQQFKNFDEITLTAVFFENDALFNEDSLSEDAVYQPPVRVMIKGFQGVFSSSLSFLYKLKPGQKGNFTYWHFGLHDGQEPVKGQWKIIEDHIVTDDIFIGKTYHSAYFSALITGHVKTNSLLRLITIIGCSFSLTGCVFVCIILFVKRSLREQEGSKLFLSSLISIVSTYFLFFVAEAIQREAQTTNIKMICILISILLHYMLLAQFSWTLILSYFQYNRYVIVYGTNASYRILKYSFLTWLVPLIPISLGICFNRLNQESNNDLCYVDKTTLKYFVLLPITVILTSNLIILIIISYSLGFKNRLKVGKNYVPYIVRMLCFNFFFLGLNWISGIALAVHSNNVILLYIFNITSTFQGFVVCCIFIFTSRNKIFSRNIRLRTIVSTREIRGLIRSPVDDQLNRINAINSV